MKAEECLEVLLDRSRSIEERAGMLGDYLRWYRALGRNMGMGFKGGGQFAIRELFGAAEKQGKDAVERVKETLDEVEDYFKEAKRERAAKAKSTATELKSVSSGTPIVIRNENREDVVFFIEANRRRFLCEYPDGRRYSVPAELFLGIYEGEVPPRLSEEERKQRELVRGLAGRQFEDVKDEIIKYGHEIVPALLGELAAALDRIKNAPVGFSSGVLGASLGPVKKISSYDEALRTRIPLLLTQIGERIGEGQVWKQVEEHPNAEVREYLKEAKRARVSEARSITPELEQIRAGTPVVIRNKNREDVVFFLGAHRTRFLCEHPAGRLWSVPAELFLRIHEGEAPKRLPIDERGQIRLVHGLAGKDFEYARKIIINRGLDMVRVLLEEAAAALDRIEKAPVGFSSGSSRATTSSVNKIGYFGDVLLWRIVFVIEDIAEKFGRDDVWNQVQAYPNPELRQICQRVLSRQKKQPQF